MNSFYRSVASIAVPTVVQTFDEISVRSCARIKAKRYILNKRIKYVLRFYAVVGQNSRFIHYLTTAARIGQGCLRLVHSALCFVLCVEHLAGK